MKDNTTGPQIEQGPLIENIESASAKDVEMTSGEVETAVTDAAKGAVEEISSLSKSDEPERDDIIHNFEQQVSVLVQETKSELKDQDSESLKEKVTQALENQDYATAVDTLFDANFGYDPNKVKDAIRDLAKTGRFDFLFQEESSKGVEISSVVSGLQRLKESYSDGKSGTSPEKTLPGHPDKFLGELLSDAEMGDLVSDKIGLNEILTDDEVQTKLLEALNHEQDKLLDLEDDVRNINIRIEHAKHLIHINPRSGITNQQYPKDYRPTELLLDDLQQLEEEKEGLQEDITDAKKDHRTLSRFAKKAGIE